MPALLLFETLLFFHNKPCYYKVFLKGDVLFGEPSPHHFYSKTSFPSFIIRKNAGGWKVEGNMDNRMKTQILSELREKLKEDTPSL